MYCEINTEYMNVLCAKISGSPKIFKGEIQWFNPSTALTSLP